MKLRFLFLPLSVSSALLSCVPRLRAQCSFPRSGDPAAVAYRFNPEATPNGLVLHVTMEFRTGSAKSILQLPMHGGGQILHSMSNLRVVSGSATLESQDLNATILHTTSHRPVVLAYELRNDWSGPLRNPLQFHPVLMPDYVQFTGHNALVQLQLPPGARETAYFDWRGIPASWSLATSFGASASKAHRCQSYTGPWRNIDQGLYAAGDYRIYRFQIGPRPAVLAIRGAWTFPDQEAIADIQNVVQNVRDFWHDNKFPYFLVTVSPFDQDHGSSDGSAFTNAFWMYLSRLDSITGLLPQLAHESFHAWNPFKMGSLLLVSDEDSMKWFKEGATEYYAELLTYRAGELSAPAYVKSIDRNVRAFSASNSEYIRGLVISLWLDATIRSESAGRHSLDDVMFDMVRQSSQPYTSARILETADHYLSPDSRKLLQAAVMEHADLPLPSQIPALAGCTRVAIESVPAFDLGFNLFHPGSAETVAGVVEDGPAWSAGLRNGQRIVDSSIHPGETDRLVRLKVHTAEGDKQIAFYPRGKPSPMNLYELESGKTCYPKALSEAHRSLN